MQTTLDLDEDVLSAAEELAARSHQSAGRVISDICRKALLIEEPSPRTVKSASGFEVIPANGRVVTAEFVRRLRDETNDL